jgi:hypothetical protein
MPSLHAISEHWLSRVQWPDYHGNIIGLGEPFCAGCRWLVPAPARLCPDGDGIPWPADAKAVRELWRLAGRFLDRAHLVDHARGGTEDVSNLVPLCHLCHDAMPSFGDGEYDKALRWVQQRPAKDWRWQFFTDAWFQDHDDMLESINGRSWMKRAWTYWLEQMLSMGTREVAA